MVFPQAGLILSLLVFMAGVAGIGIYFALARAFPSLSDAKMFNRSFDVAASSAIYAGVFGTLIFGALSFIYLLA